MLQKKVLRSSANPKANVTEKSSRSYANANANVKEKQFRGGVQIKMKTSRKTIPGANPKGMLPKASC